MPNGPVDIEDPVCRIEVIVLMNEVLVLIKEVIVLMNEDDNAEYPITSGC
jgi:hypothetical protein